MLNLIKVKKKKITANENNVLVILYLLLNTGKYVKISKTGKRVLVGVLRYNCFEENFTMLDWNF